MTEKLFKLVVICGGPSRERGISLNSARSVMDHLKNSSIEVIPFYVNTNKQFYRLSHAQLYSNNPADFDFKLDHLANLLDAHMLHAFLKEVDLVFPVIHGSFGEDGELQSMLENMNIPFIGHSSKSCEKMFHKFTANQYLKSLGFPTLLQALFSKNEFDIEQKLKIFFESNNLKKVSVKPVGGGSSIGVTIASTPEEAFKHIQQIFLQKISNQAIVEEFCSGKEFTVVVFEDKNGQPISLIPTEVDLMHDENSIFDFRKKYLPTNQATYHTPPRFSITTTERICNQAEEIFMHFEMRDFVRIDGWVMPDETIYFTDINPISGLEQNSFLFRQASLVGLSHSQVLDYIIRNACKRYHLQPPLLNKNSQNDKKPVYVLFGSDNAERQVSLMSGTNVWLKLLQSDYFHSTPFLLDPHKMVWELPYAYTLNHTVEEVYLNCVNPKENENKWKHLLTKIQEALDIPASEKIPSPQEISLKSFCKKAKKDNAFVFIAMHGGEGENGTLQKLLESYEIPFNGSNSKASALCMNKYLTGEKISLLKDPDVQTVPKTRVDLQQLKNYSELAFNQFWNDCCLLAKSNRLVIKPCSDGCSAGIALLESVDDLKRYCKILFDKKPFIPPYTFENQNCPIEMPSSLLEEFILEAYIEVDRFTINQHSFDYIPKDGWIELTVGVMEKDGHYHSFNPSITIAEGSILSLEEKFQGGTGVNLTPPPEEIISQAALEKIKSLVEKVAKALEIGNYARIDIFFNRFTEKMLVIEANSLPGLTPSTVLYHQGLAESVSLNPLDLLHKIISSRLENTKLL